MESVACSPCAWLDAPELNRMSPTPESRVGRALAKQAHTLARVVSGCSMVMFCHTCELREFFTGQRSYHSWALAR